MKKNIKDELNILKAKPVKYIKKIGTGKDAKYVYKESESNYSFDNKKMVLRKVKDLIDIMNDKNVNIEESPSGSADYYYYNKGNELYHTAYGSKKLGDFRQNKNGKIFVKLYPPEMGGAHFMDEHGNLYQNTDLDLKQIDKFKGTLLKI